MLLQDLTDLTPVTILFGIKQHLFCNFAKFLSLRDVEVVDKLLVLG